MLNLATQLIKHIKKDNPSTDADPIHLEASFTRHKKDILVAQKMRYQIFTEEYGAKIRSIRGIDKDRFDKHCLHLVVKDTFSGEIIGYTRILTSSAARLTGGFYSESEFNLNALNLSEGRTIEIGRTCIDARYRNGATIGVLWSAIGQYIRDNHVRFLIGCASISMADGGVATKAIMEKVRLKHFTDESLRVSPHKSFTVCKIPATKDSNVRLPPLLKAYLSMGAKVAGEPCWDTDFNVADVFILLDMDTVSERYKKHFLRVGG
jgi:putative hemolysin